jgi:hypothetical protein
LAETPRGKNWWFERDRHMTDNPESLQRSSAMPDTPADTAIPAEAPSPEVLKNAYNAFKKRWKLTRLDYDSRIGRGPLSAGEKSSIIGIAAPREFPRAVWEELVKQGRLKHAGSGLYAMP